MSEKPFLLRCAHCGKDTKIIIEVPEKSSSRRGKKEKKIQLVRYCGDPSCNRPNLVNVPETWDKSPWIYGEDAPVGGSGNGLPVIQGEKY